MMYFVDNDGIHLFDDEYHPIELDAALVTIRRVAAYVEAIGNERDTDPTVTVDTREAAESAATVATRLEG